MLPLALSSHGYLGRVSTDWPWSLGECTPWLWSVTCSLSTSRAWVCRVSLVVIHSRTQLVDSACVTQSISRLTYVYRSNASRADISRQNRVLDTNDLTSRRRTVREVAYYTCHTRQRCETNVHSTTAPRILIPRTFSTQPSVFPRART